MHTNSNNNESSFPANFRYNNGIDLMPALVAPNTVATQANEPIHPYILLIRKRTIDDLLPDMQGHSIVH